MTLRPNIAIVTTPHPFTFLIKLDNVLNGRYLSLEDSIFVENVIADIQHFLRLGEEHKKSVLIFPPVNNYRRFLIHKVCEETTSKELSTFSVGQGFNRRTVVCLKSLVRKPTIINNSHGQTLQNLGDQTSSTMVVERQPISSNGSSPEHHCQNGSVKRVRAAPAIYRPPAARKLEALSTQVKQNHSITPATPTVPVTSIASKSERTRSGTRQRRPDLQVYVPRAKRASMIDQNLSEQHIGHNENLSANHQIYDTKKNAPELSLKFQNTSISSNYDKACHILPSTVLEVDCNRETVLKKMDVDEPVTKENHSRVVTEDSSVQESSPKCSLEDHVVLRKDNSDSASLSIGCEIKDVHEVPNVKNCDMTNYESEELHVSITSDSNKNDCDNECEEKSCGNENTSDSCNDLQELFISDSKQCGDGKCNDHEDHINKYSNEPVYFVEDSLDSVSNLEKESQAEVPIRKNSVSESKDQANLKIENVIMGHFVSDVLVISNPEASLELVHTLTKDEENINKHNATKRSKTKNKSGSSIVAAKAESNTGTTIATSTSASATTTTSVVSLNPDECSWEMLFDDNGDCLDPKIMEELTNAVGSVTIEKPQSDYNRFISRPEINLPGGDDEFAHVIEIYNFPSEFKTQDLLSVFAPYKNGGFEIKWVDDTHALGVFSSSRVAADVLAYEHPFVKTRPLSEATPESRIKARRSSEFLQPYRARPETCVAMARRLVTGALGMRIATSREEREAERRLLKEAREKKKLAAQQQQDAWEGTIR